MADGARRLIDRTVLYALGVGALAPGGWLAPPARARAGMHENLNHTANARCFRRWLDRGTTACSQAGSWLTGTALRDQDGRSHVDHAWLRATRPRFHFHHHTTPHHTTPTTCQ
jgi:hypothetical protein